MIKILDFIKQNFFIIIIIIIISILILRRKKEGFTQNKLLKIKFNFKNKNINSYLIDSNNKIYKQTKLKKYFNVPSGIYSHYIQVINNDNNGKYIFPPKQLNNIKIENDLCLNNIYNKSESECYSNPIKLLNSNKEIKIEVYYEFIENKKKVLKQFPYVEIVAFDNNNRTMTTITDTNGKSTLKILDKDKNNDNLYWSLNYNLPTIDEIYEAITDKEYGLDTYTATHKGNKYNLYNIEKENEKFVYKPIDEDGNFVTEKTWLKYIKDNVKLPVEWVKNVKEYYGIKINSKEQLLETINKLNDVYNSVNTLIKSDDFIYKNEKKIKLPIIPSEYNSNDKIKIIIPNIDNYIRINYKIKNLKNINVKSIKVNLYIKEKDKETFDFYSKTSDVKQNGNFYVFINKDFLRDNTFKLIITSPNELHSINKIDKVDINYFTINLIDKELSVTYFNSKNKKIKNEIIKKNHIFDSSDTYNYFKYVLYNFNDHIELKKNKYEVNIDFNIPKEIDLNNIKKLTGKIIATTIDGNNTIYKEFNFNNINKNKINVSMNLYFNNNIRKWDIDYELDRDIANNYRLYFKNIMDENINSENNKVTFKLRYLDRKIDFNLKTDVSGIINGILRPTIEKNNITKINNIIFHNFTMENINKKSIYVFSNYNYDINISLNNTLEKKYLQPKIIKIKKQIHNEKTNNKFNIKLLEKNKIIKINIKNKEEYIELYCNININGIKINKNITKNNNIKLNNDLNGKIDIKILGIKKNDESIYTSFLSDEIKTSYDFNLNKSNFVNVKSKCFYVQSDLSYKLQIVKNKNMNVELISSENSITKNKTKLFIFVKSAYHLIDNTTAKYFTPINIECMTREGIKIFNTVANKSFNLSYKYSCGRILEFNDINLIKKIGLLTTNTFSNVIMNDNSSKYLPVLKKSQNNDKDSIIEEEFINTDGDLVHNFDMEMVAIFSATRNSEVINNNNSKKGTNIRETTTTEKVGEIKTTERFGATKQHIMYDSFYNKMVKNAKVRGIKKPYIFYYYIENNKIEARHMKTGWYLKVGLDKITSPHTNYQIKVIKELFSYISSKIDVQWRRTLDKTKSMIDIFSFNYKTLPGKTKSGVSGWASGLSGKNKAVICIKTPGQFGEEGKFPDFWVYVMIHELGHTIALSHPHSKTNQDVDNVASNVRNTIMSYKLEFPLHGLTQTFRDLDIKVLQDYWGKNKDNGNCPYDEGIYWIKNNNIRCKK